MKGARLDIKDMKGRTPVELAVENKSRNVLEMLQRKTGCNDIITKPPLTKVENTYFNLIFFIAIHITAVLISIVFLLPCIFIY